MKIDKNIVLIGFMGVGKGTIARALAEKLGVFAIDGDDMIESYANKKIKKIFEDEGEEAFRKIEKNLAKFLENSVKGAVISTGGGFYKVKNLKKIGTVIYLKSSFEKIIERIKNSSNSEKKFAKRPLLSNLEEAKKIHTSRDKEYEKKADFSILVEDKTEKQIISQIVKLLNSQKAKG
ncbi:shikimate kinase [Campylobacter fetus]|uniref:shikimate kinase n=1 Tax=Campylobacter fetus TaxID=196 RepID=UPI0003C28C27|nr:shikimate kinase [Campylobacter fetus]AGZ82152.1 shikimate kinase [Campylobacter fetus subsp. testudinum 03-427]EAI4322209.1 shikimate kinase [Campylobacter fetus]EAI4391843.1 shikimate kinase [Campylobacter fetus]EAK0826960.1 shikimate kinase [Campylobacter fetus]OCS06461.1 shikimate kinase [Campylobacter fetus subsp. testudinum]